MLDLVALATVADVAPLIGLNRAFVRQGLSIMARRQRPGLVALSDVAKLSTAPTPYQLGFVLGPRINVGGRVGRADLGARLLSTNSASDAAQLAQELDRLNSERREIENAVRDAALSQVEERDSEAVLAWAAGEEWHPGVVGIVASRLKEATGKPSIVMGIQDGVVKGSARSVSGIDIGSAFQRLMREGLIEKGGGHAIAAGLTCSVDQLVPAMDRLEVLLSNQGALTGEVRGVSVDGVLMPSAANSELVENLESAGPFGVGNPAPRFAFPDMKVAFAKRVGDNHLKLTLCDPTDPQNKIDAIAFSALDD